MWRYNIIGVPRGDAAKRDEVLWEAGRSGWELIHVLDGSPTDASDKTQITLYFKRSAGEDIGV